MKPTLDLPQRSHSRPRTTNRAPHRQLDGMAGPELMNTLISRLEADPHIDLGPPHSSVDDGRYLRDPNRRHMMGEFGHVHDATDGSFHVLMGRRDKKKITEAGWGEPHPSFWPAVLIYAPQDEGEFDTIMEIVHHARQTSF